MLANLAASTLESTVDATWTRDTPRVTVRSPLVRDASKAASIVSDNEHVTAVLGWIREASREGRAVVGFDH
jgi:hypothetical protein